MGTRHSWSPLGGARRWLRTRRGAWTTLRPGRAATWSHGEAGSQGTRGHRAPRQSRGERVRGGQRGCGEGGATAQGRRGPGEEEGGREAEGEPSAEQREARRRPTPRAALNSFLGPPGGEEGAREEGGGQSKPSWAGPGRAAGLRLLGCAQRGRSPPCCPPPGSQRQVGAAGWPGPQARGGLGVITAGGSCGGDAAWPDPAGKSPSEARERRDCRQSLERLPG